VIFDRLLSDQYPTHYNYFDYKNVWYQDV